MDSPLADLNQVNRTGDPELQALIDACSGLSEAQLAAVRRDDDLWRAATISPSCGAELAEVMDLAKDALHGYLAKLGKLPKRQS